MTTDLHLAGWQLLYEQRSFWRNRARAFFVLGFPLILLVTFCSLNQGATVDTRGGIPLDAVFLPGIMAYGIVIATFTNLAVETAPGLERILLWVTEPVLVRRLGWRHCARCN